MVLMIIGVVLFIAGVAGKLLGSDGAILLTGPAMILIALGSWRNSHPAQGGNDGPSTGPWGVG